MLSKTTLYKLRNAHQEHIVAKWEQLDAKGRQELENQINQYNDYNVLNEFYAKALSLSNCKNTGDDTALIVQPISRESVLEVDNHVNLPLSTVHEVKRAGLNLIAQSKCGVLIMAGGSGTRLGVTVPKGCFSCSTLHDTKSLFQLHCEKILRIQTLAHNAFPDLPYPVVTLFIMTSEENDAATKEFFQQHHYFGLCSDNVFIFSQSSLPCYSENDGKILMESNCKMCVAPSGNGDVYKSIARMFESSSITDKIVTNTDYNCNNNESKEFCPLQVMTSRLLQYIQICSVDNMLCKIADPLFFGYAVMSGAHVAVKSVAKVDAKERVGVFAYVNKKFGVIEYSEIGTERAAEVDMASGNLRYNYANIACHICSIPFLKRASVEMMNNNVIYHAARKQINTINGSVMGIKLESFIFDMFYIADALPPLLVCDVLSEEFHNTFAQRSIVVMQVARNEEFAPIKNATSEINDNVITAGHAMHKLHTEWVIESLERSRQSYICDTNNSVIAKAIAKVNEEQIMFELSPLLTYEGEELEQNINAIAEVILKTTEHVVIVDKETLLKISNEYDSAEHVIFNEHK